MLRITTFFTLLCLLAINKSILAQQFNFESGTIFLLNGEEKKGYIERNTFLKTSETIRFQENKQAAVQDYKPKQLLGFNYSQDGITYQSVSFNYYNDEGATKEKSNQKQRFAKVLVEGSISLFKVPLSQFEYNTEAYGSANYLYLIKKKDRFYQVDLLKTKYVNNQLMVSKKYKGLLTFLLNECPQIENKVKRAEFRDKDMIGLVNEYHTCIGEAEQAKIYASKEKSIKSHHLHAGYLIIKDDFADNPTAFNMGYYFSFLKPQLSQRVGGSIGLDYIYQQYFWRGSSFFRGDYKEHDLRLNFLFDFILLKKEKLTIKISPGVSYLIKLSGSASILREGAGNFALFPIYANFQWEKYSIIFGYSVQPRNFGRPDKMLNFGLAYQFK